MNKRGLTSLITNMLIMVLVFSSVVVLWAIVIVVLDESAEEISLEGFILNVDVSKAYVEGDELIVNVKRGAGEGNLKGIRFAVSDEDGNIVYIEKKVDIPQLGMKKFIFNLTELNIVSWKSVTIIPLSKLSEDVVDDEGGGDDGGSEDSGNETGGNETDYEEKFCSDCGEGLLNICDQEECEGLGNCIFTDEFIGGSCEDISSTYNCTDNDGGKNLYVKGFNSGVKPLNPYYYENLSDYCNNNNELTEYYCEANLLQFSMAYCPAGCSDGVCLEEEGTEEILCADGDGGKNYFQKGVSRGLSYLDRSFHDSKIDVCVQRADGSVNELLEWHCEDNFLKSIGVYCPYGCEDGACIEGTELPSDGTSDFCEYSYSCSSHKDCERGVFAASASCSEGNVAKSYRVPGCENPGVCASYGNGGSVCTEVEFVDIVWKDCEGEGCLSNVCLGNLTCTDTDGGIDYNLKGYVESSIGGPATDNCNNNVLHNWLHEWYCAEVDGNLQRQKITYDCFEEGKICEDGACVVKENISSCVDSDGGTKIYTAGYVESNIGGIVPDNCFDYDTLSEWYCEEVDGEIQPKVQNYWCSEGCLYGACLVEEKIGPIYGNCQDSDWGNYPFVKGFINNSYEKYNDFCLNDEEIVEFYCNNLYGNLSEIHNCPNGCVDGACVAYQVGDNSQCGNGICGLYDYIIVNTNGHSNATQFDPSPVLELDGFFYTLKYVDSDYKTINGTTDTGIEWSQAKPYRAKISINDVVSPWLMEGDNADVGGLRVHVLKLNYPLNPNPPWSFEFPVSYLILGENSRSCPEDCPIPVCTDTDVTEENLEGKNPFIKGVATKEMSHNDYCYDSTRLKEFVCPEKLSSRNWWYIEAVSTSFDCPNGCVDGACVGDSAIEVNYPFPYSY